MSITPGLICDGEISQVTHFGAFVKMSDGQEGLVHISEISSEYISDIHKAIKVGDKVSVKVLGLNPKGKWDLSIKKAVLVSQQEQVSSEINPDSFAVTKTKNFSFEDKLTSFFKQSEDKLVDWRRRLKAKNGLVKKRKPS